MEESTHPSLITPCLVGRTSQLATLQQLVEQAKQGQGRLTLISGEAGIGKSRLVAEIKSTAASQGFRLLQGQCFPADLTYPYAPLLDLLRALFASQEASPLAGELEQLASALFPLLPELVPDREIALPRLSPEQEKRRLFAVLATFFLNVSTHSPLLLILEDVHWSDETSLDFLHYLARRSVSKPLLLLVTYRHDELHPPLSNWLASLNRERLAEVLQLVSLSRSDVDAMLSAIFEPGHTAVEMRRFLHGELLDTLYALTEGNPFFVEEIVSSLVAAGDLFYVQGYWNRKPARSASLPRSVQDATRRRTERVSEAARQVLTLAAVAGRHFDFPLLQQLTQQEEGQLLLLMKELVSAQLVVEESADRFAFRHALTRQAIYTQLLARERRALHLTIATTMEQHAPNEQHLEDLASHFYQASVWHKTAAYAGRAGEKALRLYSHRAATDYFTWALEAIEKQALAPSPLLFRARGQAYEALGEFERARADYTQALEAARTTLDRTAEWQSAIDLGFLWAGRDYAQTERWFRRALDLAQALADPVLHAHSLNRLGNWHLNVEQPHEALRYQREALALFEQLSHVPGTAETLDLLGMTSYIGGDLIGGTAYYQQAVTLWRSLGDKPGLTSSLATLALRGPTYQTDTMVSATGLAQARQDTEEALTIARTIGHRSAEAYALFQLGLCLGSQGEYGRAYEAAQQSMHLAEEIEHRQWQTAAHTVLGGMCSGMLAYQQAREHFEQALQLARDMSSLFWTRMATGYLASVALLLHDQAEAETLLQTVCSPDMPAQTMAERMLWCASVELALVQGDASRALEILDRLDAAAAQGREGQSSLRVLNLRGEALATLQRPEEAEAAFEAARGMASVQGARPMQWRVCLALGRLYRTRGKHAEAEQAFATARTLIEELAASITDEPLRDHFLHQATALFPHTRPPSPRHAAKHASGGLTEREREVAALIAQEKSNREMAEILVLSERTIETHVSNILLKLGFTSRRQIAAWAIQKG